jgi:hypothetical protein
MSCYIGLALASAKIEACFFRVEAGERSKQIDFARFSPLHSSIDDFRVEIVNCIKTFLLLFFFRFFDASLFQEAILTE